MDIVHHRKVTLLPVGIECCHGVAFGNHVATVGRGVRAGEVRNPVADPVTVLRAAREAFDTDGMERAEHPSAGIVFIDPASVVEFDPALAGHIGRPKDGEGIFAHIGHPRTGHHVVVLLLGARLGEHFRAVDVVALAVHQREGDLVGRHVHVDGAYGIRPLRPAIGNLVGILHGRVVEFAATVVVGRRCLDIDRAEGSVGYLVFIQGVRPDVDMVVAGKRQVHAQFVESPVPAGILGAPAVGAREPFIVHADHDEGRRILGAPFKVHAIAQPFFGGRELRSGGHPFGIEHHEERVSVAEVVADAHLPFIAVSRIERGTHKEGILAREVVGNHRIPGPVVVVAIDPGPQEFVEIVFLEHPLPEGITTSPGHHVARAENHVDRRVETLHGVDHGHSDLKPRRNRRVAVEVGDDAGRPVLRPGRPERMLGASRHRNIPVFLQDHIFVVRVGFQVPQGCAAFGKDSVFHDVAVIGCLGRKAIKGGVALVLGRLDVAGFFPFGVSGFRQPDTRARDRGVAGPADADRHRCIGARSGGDAVKFFGNGQVDCTGWRRAARQDKCRNSGEYQAEQVEKRVFHVYTFSLICSFWRIPTMAMQIRAKQKQLTRLIGPWVSQSGSTMPVMSAKP